jgi:hypothetical protein
MQTFFTIAIALCLLAVLGTLVMGLVQMVRGNDPRKSNKLMQQRVLFQGIALVLFAIFLFMMKG